MPLHHILYIIVVFTTAAIEAALAFYSWRRRATPGVMPFVWLMLAMAGWSLVVGLEMVSSTPEAAFFWFRVRFISIASVPVTFLAIALQYTGREGWLTRRRLALLLAVPLITQVLIWTNETHGLFIKSLSFSQEGPWLFVDEWTYGVWFWAHTAYGYLLILLGVSLVVLTLVRSSRLYRRQAVSLLFGTSLPLVAAIFIFQLITGLRLFVPFSFTLMGLVFTWDLFRYRVLVLMPVARSTLVDTMSDGMIVLDDQNRVVDVNPAAQSVIGIPASEAIGQPAAQILSPWQDLVDRFQDKTETQAEIALDRDRAQRHYDLRTSPLTDWHGRLTGRLIVLRDITERKRAEETIRQLAYHDSLTGLPNRRLFSDRLNLAMAHAHRSQQKLAVMLFDLDHFKEVNDTLGHSVGDKLLQAVGERLTSLLRKEDTVARMGGDEFMLLLPEIAGVEDADQVAQKVLEALRKPFVLNGHEIHISTSIGIALYPDDGEDVDALMKNADIAMYRAKDQGRDNYQCYTPTGIILEKEASNVADST